MSKITVRHPDFGSVVFTNPTLRQEEILRNYNKMRTACKYLYSKHMDDSEIPDEMRRILRKKPKNGN